jgi:LysM repeat protein
MKSILKEEISQMKYLFNYDKSKVLSEQKKFIVEESAPGGLKGDWDSGTGTYTIFKGDTLSKIGNAFGVAWKDIFEKNKNNLKSKNANLIYVGEKIVIPGKESTTTTTTDDTTTPSAVADTTDTTTTDTTDVTTTDTEEESNINQNGKKSCREEAKKQNLQGIAKWKFMKKCKSELKNKK